MFLLNKNNIKFLIFFNLFIFQNIFSSDLVVASESKNIPKIDYIRNIPKNNFYILGPGDALNIKVSKEAIDLESNVFINGEGTINLNRLDKIYVEGLTINELENILNKEYSYYVNKPNVKISLVKYRPISVLIKGEVENPGIHILSGSLKENSTKNPDKPNSEFTLADDNIFFPTVIDVIKKSGGLTTNSDLTKVTLIRENSISNGGGRIKTAVDILKVLSFEDTSQNIRVFDGDLIKIAKSEVPLLKQLKKINQSNLQPKYIQVFVGGRVDTKGYLKINRSSTLVEALLMSGGVKVIKGPIRFLRYENDGSVDERKFRYNRSARKGSFKNPFLENGDYIMVGKSSFNIASEVIQEVTSPFAGIAATLRVYEYITD